MIRIVYNLMFCFLLIGSSHLVAQHAQPGSRPEVELPSGSLWSCQVSAMSDTGGTSTGSYIDTRSAKGNILRSKVSYMDFEIAIHETAQGFPDIKEVEIYKDNASIVRQKAVAEPYESLDFNGNRVPGIKIEIKLEKPVSVTIAESVEKVTSVLLFCRPRDRSGLDRIGYSPEKSIEKKLEALRKIDRKKLSEKDLHDILYFVDSHDPDKLVKRAATRMVQYQHNLDRKQPDNRLPYFSSPNLPGWAKSAHEYTIQVHKDQDCSGAIIAKKFVLTASHCVDDGPHETVGWVYDENGKARKVKLKLRFAVMNRRRSDFAIYEITDGSKINSANFLPIDDFSEEKGTHYFVSGFPNKGPNLGVDPALMISPAHQIGYESALDFTDRSVARPIPPRLSGYGPVNELLSMGAQVYSGNSGGPIVQSRKTGAGYRHSVVGVIAGGNGSDIEKQHYSRGHGSRQIAETIRGLSPALAKEMGLSDVQSASFEQVLKHPIHNENTGVDLHLEEFSLKNKTIRDIDFRSVAFGSCHLEDVTFRYVSFYDVDFSKCTFKNVRCEKCVYSTLTKWPEGYSPAQKINLGPLPTGRTGHVVPKLDYAGGDYRGINLPRWLPFDKAEVTFRDSDISNASLEGIKVKLEKTKFQHTSFSNWSNDEPTQKKIKSQREMFLSSDTSPQINSAFLGPRSDTNQYIDWAPKEIAKVKNYMVEIEKKFPKFVSQLKGSLINFRRAEKILGNSHGELANALTSQEYFRTGDSPQRSNVDITFSDRILNATHNINEVPKLKMTLFHELVHAWERRNDSRNYFSVSGPKDSELSYENDSELYKNTQKAWERYVSLKKAGKDGEATKFSYEYATQHGYPSIYAMTAPSHERRAEYVAFGALDPNFAQYAPVSVQESVKKILEGDF